MKCVLIIEKKALKISVRFKIPRPPHMVIEKVHAYQVENLVEIGYYIPELL